MQKLIFYLSGINKILAEKTIRIKGETTKKAILCLTLAVSIAGCKKDVQEGLLEAETANKAGSAQTSATPDFQIALLPDTQFYTDPDPNQGNGNMAMFHSQIDWIINNRVAENIVYVGGLGDITDSGDVPGNEFQWTNAKAALYKLENPTLTGLPQGIPYGLAVGNHDQRPQWDDPAAPCAQYNSAFGRTHFTPGGVKRAYYGGNRLGTGSNRNEDHYDLFSVGTGADKMDFIVIYINNDNGTQPGTMWGTLNSWASGLCNTFSSRKAIIITHYFVGNETPIAQWSPQGQSIYTALRARKNIFMFASGHITGQGYRQDTYNGSTIKTFESDYQGWAGGGNGYFRLMKFSKANDLITVRTYSPYINHWLAGFDGNFTRPWFHSPTSVRINDYVNQGKSQLSFFNNGTWKVYGQANVTNGQAGDIPCPGDYNGDGKTDMVVFRPSNATWYNLPGGTTSVWGNPASADIPVPGDYTGDGKFDLAIFRPSEGKWYIQGKGNYVLGQNGDIPIPGDRNGDGVADLTTYRPSNFTFYRNNDVSYTFPGASAADIPVPGDYNADGKFNAIAVYRPSTGEWLIEGMTTSKYPSTPIAGVIPCPGDYDGDGDSEKSYYNPADGKLYNSTTGLSISMPASSGDKILNLPYPIRNIFFP